MEAIAKGEVSSLSSCIIEMLRAAELYRAFARSPRCKRFKGFNRLMMVLPANEYGNMLNVNSDRLQILLFTNIEINEENVLELVAEPAFQDLDCMPGDMKIGNYADGELGLAYTTDSSFISSYDDIMHEVYSELRDAFPEVVFEFNGMRVMTFNFCD